jgi:heparan-alpha-glucosaminide N-acetyltransferase
MSAASLPLSYASPTTLDARPAARATSIDALRGFIMFAMIFVNDIASAPRDIVPWWMEHYHPEGNGMTFVDLVFPAFLFIVGMSIPFALGARIARGEPLWKTMLHVVTRTLSLLVIGIMMVNGPPAPGKSSWNPSLWRTLMFVCAILAFSTLSPRRRTGTTNDKPQWSVLRITSLALRIVGFVGLVALAFAFRSRKGNAIIELSPFKIYTRWYGILGLIGWAYLMGSIVYLAFRTRRTAIVGCMALLFCLYAADKGNMFKGWPLREHVSIGIMLGSHAAITVAGLLLASILITPQTSGVASRSMFALWFIAGCSIAALLLYPLYGINKNNATPSWCLWACAITAALWLIFYYLADVLPLRFLTKPFAIAGQNVLLAYLLSNLLDPLLDVIHLDAWYDRLAEPNLAHAVARSVGCAVVILTITAILNRLGFRLKL